MALAGDQAELVRALQRHGVDFVVVGGVAAQMRGWQGATAALDIALAPGDDNAERLNRVLADDGVTRRDIGGLGTSFVTRYGRLGVVRRADGVGMYEDWRRNASTVQLEGMSLLVAGPADIIRSKEASGREKDRAALPGMRRAFGLEP